MSESSTPDPGQSASAADDRSLPARGWQRLEDAVGRGRLGTISLLAGGALLARAATGRGSRRLLQAAAGVGLLGLGVRQRLTREGAFEAGDAGSGTGRGDGDDDATSGVETGARTAHAVESGTNPRDVSQEPDVDAETDPDEGSVRFTTEGDDEPRPDPHLEAEDEGDRDPRIEGEDDETEIDLSKSAMADEPNEAVGPRSEQAQPSSTEGTEPEPTPEEDTSHVQADEPGTAGEDGDADSTGDADESGEDVSTEDRYEGERGDDATVEGSNGESRGETDEGERDDEDQS